LLHRQIGRLGTLQDSVHEICDAPVAVRLDLLAITHLLVAGTDQIPAPQAVGFFFKPFTNSGCRNGVLNEKSEKLVTKKAKRIVQSSILLWWVPFLAIGA
jgi:hypothetical protein